MTELIIGSGLALTVQLVLFLRWLYRQTRDHEIARAFVRDLAVNHLPHIYGALRQIAAAQDIALEEPPQVQFLEVNGRKK